MTQTLEPPRVETRPVEPEEPASSSLLRVGLLVGAVIVLGVLFGWTVVAVIAAIMASILLHEFGHFLAAAPCTGMKAPEFFAGFGPKLWSFKRGETEYGLKAVLVGGYVKIIGMNNLEEVDPADEARTFRQQSYPKRVLVAFAGPGMNLLLAFVILLVVVMGWGVPQEPAWPWVTPVDNGAAALAGMEEGDRIVSFDGETLPADFSADGDTDDFVSLVQSHAGQTVEVVVERDGESIPLTVDVGLMIVGMTGIEWPEVSSVRPGTPASAVGLQPEDQIVEVAGSAAPASYDTFVDTVEDAAGENLDLVVRREGELYSATVAVPAEVQVDGFLGVSPYLPPSEPERNPVVAVREAGSQGGEFVWLSLYGMGRFFSPSGLSSFADRVVSTPPVEDDDAPVAAPTAESETQVDEAAHPPLPIEPNLIEAEGDRVHSILGIITIGSQLGAADQVLVLIALLNVFLAIFNLVPLLPFDGGHIAVATYERIREGLAKRKLVAAKIVGSRYFADYAKLLPLTYVVVALVIVIGMGALYLDAVDPVDLGN